MVTVTWPLRVQFPVTTAVLVVGAAGVVFKSQGVLLCSNAAVQVGNALTNPLGAKMHRRRKNMTLYLKTFFIFYGDTVVPDVEVVVVELVGITIVLPTSTMRIAGVAIIPCEFDTL